MNYLELIKRALKGRSVNSIAKEWGITQVTLNRYVNGNRLPDFSTAKKLAEEAGIELGEAFVILAEEEKRRKNNTEILSKSFDSLLCIVSNFSFKNRKLA